MVHRPRPSKDRGACGTCSAFRGSCSACSGTGRGVSGSNGGTGASTGTSQQPQVLKSRQDRRDNGIRSLDYKITLTSLILFGLWTVDCLRLELHWCHQPSVFPFGTTRFWLVRRWGAVLAAIFLPKTSPNLERQLLPLLELKESCLDFGCWFQATCNLGLWTLQKMRPCMLSPEQFHAWQQLAT